MIGSSFASDWLREWREFLLDQSKSEVKQTNAISDYCRHSIDNCLKSEKINQYLPSYGQPISETW